MATLNHRLPAVLMRRRNGRFWVESRRPPRLGCANWLELDGAYSPDADGQEVPLPVRWAGEVEVESCCLVRVEHEGGESVAIYASQLLER